MGGTYVNSSGSSSTLTVRIKYGATTLYGDATQGFASGANTMAWVLDFTLGASATNAQRMNGRFEVSENSQAATTGFGDLSIATGSKGGSMNSPLRGTSAIDSTAVQTLLVTIQHSQSSASTSISKELVIAELIQ